jgi:SAM-dependent methyltransferase
MAPNGENLILAQKRIAELETELDVQTKHSRLQIEDLTRQIDQARINDADLKRQLESARVNDADLKDQLERSRANTEDVQAQLENARIERLHLVERLQTAVASRPGFWNRLFGRTASATPIPPVMAMTRRRVSRRYLRGSGLEIGALHSPMSVKRGVRVRHTDRLRTIDLRLEYPEWDHLPFVDVDLIDDGERLDRVDDESQDFVIASHMLEHCENPLGTLRQHLTKLKPGGVLFYIVPDRRGGFDVERPLTSFEHIVRDDQEGPAWSRWDHYLEFSRLANKSPADEVETIAKQMMEANSSIHFHVWEDSTFREFLVRSREILDESFDIEHFEMNHAEIISVLRKANS